MSTLMPRKRYMKLARFFEEDAEALIVFSVEKNQNNVELTVHGAGKPGSGASESTSDMFASIDAAVATIEGQIRKNKTRLARRLRQDAFTRTVQEETSFVPETEEDDLSLKKVKSFYFKPMTREEAVMQMNLLEHNFFAFRDEDNGGSFAVVYRRNDGGYGLTTTRNKKTSEFGSLSGGFQIFTENVELRLDKGKAAW